MDPSGRAKAHVSMTGPGVWETLKELFLGSRRPLDCVQVEVSTRCPGRCGYCPHTRLAGRWQSADMALDTFQRLWPLMRRSHRVHLQGWGEPLLHSGFFQMAALARRAGCAVSTTTSGLCMSPAMAEQLVSSGLDIVAFSLAGADAPTNGSRSGVAFDQVRSAIETLQGVRRRRQGVHLEIHIAYLLLASNLEAVRGLPELMQDLGVHAAVISTLGYVAAPDLTAEAFGRHEKDKLARAAAVLAQTAHEARGRGLDFHWTLPGQDPAGDHCRENPVRSLFAAVDGSLSPCVYTCLPLAGNDPLRRVFGNVTEADALAIWERQAYVRFRGGFDERCQQCIKRFERPGASPA